MSIRLVGTSSGSWEDGEILNASDLNDTIESVVSIGSFDIINGVSNNTLYNGDALDVTFSSASAGFNTGSLDIQLSSAEISGFNYLNIQSFALTRHTGPSSTPVGSFQYILYGAGSRITSSGSSFTPIISHVIPDPIGLTFPVGSLVLSSIGLNVNSNTYNPLTNIIVPLSSEAKSSGVDLRITVDIGKGPNGGGTMTGSYRNHYLLIKKII